MTDVKKLPFEDYLKIEQVNALYGSLPFILIATFGVSAFTVAILWDAYNHVYLSIWLIIATLIVLARWWTARSYLTETIDKSNHTKWLTLFCVFAFLTGTHFGLIAIFFLSEEHQLHVLFITCLYTGYLAATSSRTGFYIPAFVSFGLPASILFSIGHIRQDDTVNFSIGLMVLFYFVVMLMFAKNNRDLFTQGRESYYKNNQLLEEIIVQKDTAEQAVDAKNQFLAAASHDLRQPLHAMGLFIDALKPHIENDSGTLILEKISQSKYAINGLLHGLLDISRLDANVVENYPKHISLSTMMESIESEHKLHATEKNILLELDINPDHIVYIDPVLFERVIRNLVDNAIKYTHKGKVTIKSLEKETAIQIIVQDTGIGIPSDKTEVIFIEFSQLNNPERDRQKGLGLGLSIVDRLCKLMKVEYTLQTEENKGTLFQINAPKGNLSKVISTASSKETLMQGLKIIVIDDEQDILMAMKAILSNWGCDVILAMTGDEAFQLLHESDLVPDIIIADFRLRDNENGIELIEKIREEYNDNINAILITGDTAPDRLQMAQVADVMLLHKPVDAKELSNKILSLLEHSHLKRHHPTF